MDLTLCAKYHVMAFQNIAGTLGDTMGSGYSEFTREYPPLIQYADEIRPT